MKKALVCSLIIGAMLSFTCQAQVVCDRPEFLSDGYVVVKGTSDLKYGAVTFKAYKEDSLDEYVAVLEEVTNADGEFSFKFRIPQVLNSGANSNGTYSYKIKTNTEDSFKDTFEYISFEDMVKRINQAASKDEFYAIINNASDDDKAVLKVMGIATDKLYENTDRIRAITDACFDEIDLSNASKKEIETVINSVVGLENAKLNKIDTALELINPSYNELEYQKVDADKKTLINAVVKANCDTSSLDAFKNCYILSNKIIDFKNLSSPQIVELISSYDEYIKFSSTDEYAAYNNMSLSKKGSVAEKIVEKLDDSVLKADELVKIFQQAVEAVSGQSGGGSGGGNSGSGGGNTGSYANKTVDKIYQVEVDTAAKNSFTDLANVEWAAEAIGALLQRGIVSGTGNELFEPDRNVTREEFTKMAILACGLYDNGAECSFTDTEKSQWYYTYIASAAENGIINGITEDSFGIGQKIKRADMAVIIKRAAEVTGRSFNKINSSASFADMYTAPDYAKESIEILYGAGIINGVGGNLFAPNENCTRAQAAKIIYEAFVK